MHDDDAPREEAQNPKSEAQDGETGKPTEGQDSPTDDSPKPAKLKLRSRGFDDADPGEGRPKKKKKNRKRSEEDRVADARAASTEPEGEGGIDWEKVLPEWSPWAVMITLIAAGGITYAMAVSGQAKTSAAAAPSASASAKP